MIKRKLEIKDNPKQDVVIAIDISNDDINLSNLKEMVKMFKDLTENYLMAGSLVLFNDEIRYSSDIRDYNHLDEFNLQTNKNVNFDNMFNYVKEFTVELVRRKSLCALFSLSRIC